MSLAADFLAFCCVCSEIHSGCLPTFVNDLVFCTSIFALLWRSSLFSVSVFPFGQMLISTSPWFSSGQNSAATPRSQPQSQSQPSQQSQRYRTPSPPRSSSAQPRQVPPSLSAHPSQRNHRSSSQRQLQQEQEQEREQERDYAARQPQQQWRASAFASDDAQVRICAVYLNSRSSVSHCLARCVRLSRGFANFWFVFLLDFRICVSCSDCVFSESPCLFNYIHSICSWKTKTPHSAKSRERHQARHCEVDDHKRFQSTGRKSRKVCCFCGLSEMIIALRLVKSLLSSIVCCVVDESTRDRASLIF